MQSRMLYWAERFERLLVSDYAGRYDICLKAAARAMEEYDMQAATHWLGMAQVQVNSVRDRQNVVAGKRSAIRHT